jgi:hypothetical protein
MDNELQATTRPNVLERVRDALLARAMASPPDHRLKMMGVPSRAGEPIFPPSRGPSLLMAPELYSSGQGGLPELRGRRYP